MTTEYKTKDLVLAAYLKYNGAELSRGYELPTKSWIFFDAPKCEELALTLHNSKSCVELVKYEAIRRNLLGMVHDRAC